MSTPERHDAVEHHASHPVTETKPLVQEVQSPSETQPEHKVEPAHDNSNEQEVSRTGERTDKPDESPYVVKQAQQKDQVMTDDSGKTATQIHIENVLAEGLEQAYMTMTPPQQEKFRKRGEEVARAIELLVDNFKLTAKKVLYLIQSWLRLIPHVNKFFLEQEAKLKTDEIMKWGNKEITKRKHFQ